MAWKKIGGVIVYFKLLQISHETGSDWTLINHEASLASVLHFQSFHVFLLSSDVNMVLRFWFDNERFYSIPGLHSRIHMDSFLISFSRLSPNISTKVSRRCLIFISRHSLLLLSSQPIFTKCSNKTTGLISALADKVNFEGFSVSAIGKVFPRAKLGCRMHRQETRDGFHTVQKCLLRLLFWRS